MNKKQALSMLVFIADLYNVIQAPDDPPTVTGAADNNGKGNTTGVQKARPMTVPAD